MSPSNPINALMAVLASWLFALPADATVLIDMEGRAPAGGLADAEIPPPPEFNGFTITVSHGHFAASTHPSVGFDYADNGSDTFLHDDARPLIVQMASGAPFTILSFDATEWSSQFAGGQPVLVKGVLSLGGTISTSFVTAPRSIGVVPTFQSFSFDASWVDLASVEFSNINAAMAYDNIAVTPAAAVPELCPIALWLGLTSLAAARTRLGRSRGAA